MACYVDTLELSLVPRPSLHREGPGDEAILCYPELCSSSTLACESPMATRHGLLIN